MFNPADRDILCLFGDRGLYFAKMSVLLGQHVVSITRVDLHYRNQDEESLDDPAEEQVL
jgi:hypothetical protein